MRRQSRTAADTTSREYEVLIPQYQQSRGASDFLSYTATSSSTRTNKTNHDGTLIYSSTNERLPYSGSDFVDPSAARMERQQQKIIEGEGHGATETSPFRIGLVCICNIIGGACLALPSAAVQSSLIGGVFLLCFNALVSFVNLYYIVKCADYCDELNYRKLIDRALHPALSLFGKLALVIFPFGALISYVRVIADAMPPVVVEFFGASPDHMAASELFWVLVGGAVFFILSCRMVLSELFIVSIFGLLTIFFAVAAVVIRFFDGSYSETKTPASTPEGFNSFYVSVELFQFLPVVSFALSVHNNAPSYYKELPKRTPTRMMKVFGVVHIVVVVSYLTMMIFGLLIFGNERLKEQSHGDIMDAFRFDDTLMNVARLLLFIHFVSVFPILEVATRRGVNNLVLGGEEKLTYPLMIGETFVICVISCVIGYFAKNIENVFAITGALFGSIVVLILPSLLYLQLVPPEYDSAIHDVVTYRDLEDIEAETACCTPTNESYSWLSAICSTRFLRGFAYFSVFWGVLCCALGLYTSIKAVIEEGHESGHHHHHQNLTEMVGVGDIVAVAGNKLMTGGLKGP